MIARINTPQLKLPKNNAQETRATKTVKSEPAVPAFQLMKETATDANSIEKTRPATVEHILHQRKAITESFKPLPVAPGQIVQRKEGDYEKLPSLGNSKFYIRYLGGVMQAEVLLVQGNNVTLGLSDVSNKIDPNKHSVITLNKDTINGNEFEIEWDNTIPQQEWENQVKEHKKQNFETVFYTLASKGQDAKDNDPAPLLEIAQKAHFASDAKSFTESQMQYQHILTDTLKLSKATILDFHRSTGYEYEFSNFHLQNKIDEKDNGEILRSHVLLAKSDKISDIFGLSFRLETDSHNTLEMVAPPFLFLISDDTKSVIKNTFDKYEKAAFVLRKLISDPQDTLISNKLNDFSQVGFGSNWAWIGPMQNELCATSVKPKHGSGVYGQVNISLTSEEIINVIEHQLDPSKKVSVSSQPQPVSKPVILFTRIFEPMWESVGNKKELQGIIALYARSASNIFGIPSILYRNITEKRPENNYATDIKETLGIWVKDFPYLIITDYIKNHPEIKSEFIHSLTQTQRTVEFSILNAIEEDMRQYVEKEEQKLTSFYSNKIEFIKKLKVEKIDELKVASNFESIIEKEVKKEKEKEIILAATKFITPLMGNWDQYVEGQKATRMNYIRKMNTDFLEESKKEYFAMYELLIHALESKEIKRASIPGREVKEEFGKGQGVRKETYLGELPGRRGLRVTEIRNQDDIQSLEDKINA